MNNADRAWITVIEPAQAGEQLAQVYARINPRGNISNILAVQSLDPEALEAHHRLYRTLMYGPSALSRTQREAIAVVVSLANRCHY